MYLIWGGCCRCTRLAYLCSSVTVTYVLVPWLTVHGFTIPSLTLIPFAFACACWTPEPHRLAMWCSAHPRDITHHAQHHSTPWDRSLHSHSPHSFVYSIRLYWLRLLFPPKALFTPSLISRLPLGFRGSNLGLTTSTSQELSTRVILVSLAPFV